MHKLFSKLFDSGLMLRLQVFQSIPLAQVRLQLFAIPIALDLIVVGVSTFSFESLLHVDGEQFNETDFEDINQNDA